ncbi:Lsr2 family protein [Mycolicibacterium smegmatis]|nr:Lsr2 family protein [Mycolicibacterium smegmatis]ULN36256.1 Lsr2 family protein [Mycolicibacterium smegmatis]ULN71346.1 Lsr2 family protein [Mycolicibacterium smegmatis]STZ33532.1 Lsr2 protein [Mycolicibacterium smegmatis]
MGKIVTIDYIDDLDGVPIDEKDVDTVEFSYRGEDYTLVLTTKNGAQFNKDIARYIKAAKKAKADDGRVTRKAARARKPAEAKAASKAESNGTSNGVSKRASNRALKAAAAKGAPKRKASSRRTASKTAGASSQERSRAIREWARANGHSVSERGRLSTEIITAYEAANQ